MIASYLLQIVIASASASTSAFAYTFTFTFTFASALAFASAFTFASVLTLAFAFASAFTFTFAFTFASAFASCLDTSACIGLELVGYEQGPANDILHVYPNPAKDFFRLDYSGPFQQVYIEILDVLGRVRYQGLHQDNDVVMFPKGMEPGMFFVKVGSNGTNRVVPIIVH